MILQTKLLVLSGIVAVASGYAALKQHDATVAWRALAHDRADSLKAKDKTIVTLIHGIAQLDATSANDRQRYEISRRHFEHSLDSLDAQMDSLVASAPDSVKPLVREVAASCKVKTDLIVQRLSECDRLRSSDSVRINARDKVIRGLADSRDGYLKLYESAQKRVGQPSWLVNLKIGVGIAAGLVAGHFLR